MQLPLKCLGLLAPLLCWVERADLERLSRSQRMENSYGELLRTWLARELPTYSLDSLDDILTVDIYRASVFNIAWRERSLEMMDPPYDLTQVFDELADRYLFWNTGELAIQPGMIGEYHSLLRRMPLSHLIHYFHARAVVRGNLDLERARITTVLPETVPPGKQGIRKNIEKGLTDTHIHLGGLLHSDDSWADNLIGRSSPLRNFSMSRNKRNVLFLGQMALKMMAWTLVITKNGTQGVSQDIVVHLESMLQRMDDLFQESKPAAATFSAQALEEGYYSLVQDLFHRHYSSTFRRHQGLAKDQAIQAYEHRQKKAYRGERERLFVEAKFETTPEIWPHRLIWLTEHQWLAPLLVNRARDVRQLKHLADRISFLEKLHFEIHHSLQTSAQLALYQTSAHLPDHPNSDQRQSQPIHLIRQRFAETMHRLFFRYLIYQTKYWTSATQAGRSTGLRTFKTYYDSETRKRWRDSWEAKAVAFERMCNDPSLSGLEGRIAPPESVEELSNWLFLYGRNRYKLKRFGLIVHFIKSEQISHSNGRFGIRYGHVRSNSNHQALKLYNILIEPHPAVPFIVGIDAANLELTTPPEVFAPAFRFLREHPISFKRYMDRFHPYRMQRDYLAAYDKRQLGMTYHAGEDFRHLLSGLRAIDEVIRFLKPNQDDRLGHAIALAIKPQLWFYQLGGQALIPKQEWLDTMVWIFAMLGGDHPLIRRLNLGDRIRKLSHEIFGNRVANLHFQTRPFQNEDFGNLSMNYVRRQEMGHLLEDLSGRGTPWTISELFDAWRLRQLDPHCPPIRRRIFNQQANNRHSLNAAERRWWDIQIQLWHELDRTLSSRSSYLLLQLYWFDTQVRKIGDEIFTLNMHENREDWIALCKEAQKCMRAKVQKHSLVVEACPSSNLLIGHYDRLDQHHIFKLTTDKHHQLKKRILVTINTDNPGFLHTSLAHEYFLLANVLLQKGVPKPRVIEWIEWLRINGETYNMLSNVPTNNELERFGIVQQLEVHHRAPRHLETNPSGRFLSWFHNAHFNSNWDFTTKKNLRHEVINLILAQEGDQASFKKLQRKLGGQQDYLHSTKQEHEDLKSDMLELLKRIEELEKDKD